MLFAVSNLFSTTGTANRKDNTTSNRRSYWADYLMLPFRTYMDFTVNVTPNTTTNQHHKIVSRNSNIHNDRRFMTFDEAAPRVLLARSHALPDAVPRHRVIPMEYAHDEQYHILKRTNTSTLSIIGERGQKRPYYSSSDNIPYNSGNYNWEQHRYQHDHRALYLYNPSIVPLQQPDTDPLTIIFSHKDYEDITGGDVQVQYLATFRANIGGNCFGSDKRKVMQTGEQISYLAVALLDGNLNLIPHSDVLIDINAGPSFGKYYMQFQEDCKAVVLWGKLYFLCNETLFRVHIRRRVNTTNVSTNDTMENNFHTGSDRQIPYRYPNIYGNGLDITLLKYQRKIAGGKNFNVFRVPAAATNESLSSLHSKDRQHSFDYYLQVYPLPHRYHRLIAPTTTTGPNDPDGTIHKEPEQTSPGKLPPPSFDGPDTPNVITTCPENEKVGSRWITNCTNPITSPFFGDLDHGTACCITLSLPNHHGTVLMGISHTKTSGIRNPWWTRDIYNRYTQNNITIGHRQYLSRLVAYQSTPPFDVVARSGWFCLGFAVTSTKVTSESGRNTLAGQNSQYQLDLFRTTHSYNCPMIHFASGLSEYVNDPTKAIIAYGVADCYPRMIVVEKSDLVSRLLGGN